MMRKQEISVLIPTYNHVCVALVKGLAQQLEASAARYEIVVADDGSTDAATDCRYIVREENVGRAAIRNFLVREAQQPYVLFIDSDMTLISDDFIRRYLDSDCDTVIDGGVAIGGDPNTLKGNLRYRYEKAEEARHTAPERQKSPYQHLHTANLFVSRELMLEHPFDERFRRYGYEDVLLGKTFHQHHIAIEHIDNQLGFCTFESNADFVAKTEEGLRTLGQFSEDLRGYSRLLTFVSNIHFPTIKTLIRLWHRTFGPLERRLLCGRRPSLTVFKLYRLGYFLSVLVTEEPVVGEVIKH